MCNHCVAETRRTQARFWLSLASFHAVARRVLYTDLVSNALVASAEAHKLAPDTHRVC